MDKQRAIEIQALALNAITDLNRILLKGSDYQAYEEIKKGVGISVAYVDTAILAVIYKQFPELDHIKNHKDS